MFFYLIYHAMKRISHLLFSLSLLSLSAFCGSVLPEEASRVALRFISERISPAVPSRFAGLEVSETFIIRDQETPLYYLFNLKPEGWIAIAADDAVFPILAYSFEGQYEESHQAPQFTAWMNQYKDQIRYAIRENVLPYSRTETMWKRYTDPQNGIYDKNSSSLVLRSVEPLITSHWNQSPWYNELCPADPAGPGGHCVAGCVPVCMAQVMYYFRWPETGTGSYTYTEPNYGVLSANFGETTYPWDKMTNSINRSNLAIAELIFHLGVSCDLQYGPSGSGMYNHKAAYSLRTYFKYAPETQYLFRDSTNLNWDSVLIAHLDRKIPMYYAGWSVPNINGHAFVCDGYQDSCFFHFNFGWGGNSDGYFYTSDLTPGGNNFNLAQEVVINCIPDTLNYTYPVQCSGSQELTNLVGSFEDGSGPVDDYLPTASCTWLINPQSTTDSVTSMTLNFDRFDTNPTDFLKVYDGGTNSDPMIGSYSGEPLPAQIISSGNQLLVTFTASGNPPANGFLVNYKANQPVWCTGLTSIKADTAEISDGSYGFNYYNSTLCKWKLETESGDPLTIWFDYFDTEEGHDYLTIYDLGSGDTLASLSGNYTGGILPDSVTSPSGKMFLIFSSNSSITADGWKLYYPKRQHIGITEKQHIRNLRIFPNPSAGKLTIEFTSDTREEILVSLQQIDGRMVSQHRFQSATGWNRKEFDIFDVPSGIYLIQIRSQQELLNQKVIKH